MPEGDTIFRAARTLNRAFAGHTVTSFESVFPHLTRIDQDQPLRGRTIERVESRGKHLLMWFSGALVLRTHMRMNGSWHLYRPGERWQRPRHEMRIVIATDELEAVAFSVPVAEFLRGDEIERQRDLRRLGPDPLSDAFEPAEAVARLTSLADTEIAEALLDQRAIAGIGNIYKAEVLFVARVHPFTLVRNVEPGGIERLVTTAVRLMRANTTATSSGIVTYSGLRRATRADPSARLWVYGRAGQPCRRCGTAIVRKKQGPNVRSTYWCPKCQPPGPKGPALRE
jgi:endonuclease-8